MLRFCVWELKTFRRLILDIGFLRVIAFIIDSIIIGVVTWIIFSFVLYSLLFTAYLIFPLVLGILEVLYFAILDVAWGGTIGKRIIGLEVQMTNGNKVTFDKALLRNISKIYWIFLLLDWLVALFTTGADRQQKYSDRMAGTTVVQRSAPFASLTQTPQQNQPPPTQ